MILQVNDPDALIYGQAISNGSALITCQKPKTGPWGLGGRVIGSPSSIINDYLVMIARYKLLHFYEIQVKCFTDLWMSSGIDSCAGTSAMRRLHY